MIPSCNVRVFDRLNWRLFGRGWKFIMALESSLDFHVDEMDLLFSASDRVGHDITPSCAAKVNDLEKKT